MIGGDGFESFFGLTGSNFHDMIVNIVSRAIKVGGYSIVLLQPGTDVPACFATDTAIKRGHLCQANPIYSGLWDVLEPHEDPRKVRPMVTAAVARVTERYAGVPNLAVVMHEPLHAGMTSFGAVGGLLVVPPSVVGGQVVRLV